MRNRTFSDSLSNVAWTLILGWGIIIASSSVAQAQPELKKAGSKWTVDQALAHLRLYPNDAYLQYVALQLAQREGVAEDVARQITQITNSGLPEWQRRAGDVNIFGLFSGTLAIQESLQLEVMAGAPSDPRQPRNRPSSKIISPEASTVPVATLQGPTTRSHPWSEMLAGRKPELSEMAALIPEEQYYIRFKSVSKLLDVLKMSDTWGDHLLSQSGRKAYASQVNERLMTQLAVETSELLKPFYDLVVSEIVATGSDLYLTRGSDVTLIFRYKQPVVFRTQMEAFRKNVEKSHPNVVKATASYRGVEYSELRTPDRRVHVFAAYFGDDLHLRSNSLSALKRIIDTHQDSENKIVSLAESDEFAYIRTLMTFDAKEEDGFIYLSDPLIRRLTGPQLKLTELRRVVCYNHLRMLSHARALYETEQERPSKSIDELKSSECIPEKFNDGPLACPCGGTYSLDESGTGGVCSHHGRIGALVPGREILEEKVTQDEAKMYKDFVTAYERYWQTFFDPIAIRLTVNPDEFRAETIILPLINNSFYQGMASVLGSEPQSLEHHPVPNRNIFSLAFQVDKDRLVRQSGWMPVPAQQADSNTPEFLIQTNVQRLRQLALAMHNYHDAQKKFPPAASHTADGKQLLSWRVHLLPYLGHAELYQEFHLDEPWSSAHNRSLIAKIPNIYSIPGEPSEEGRTTFQVVVGESTIFDGSGEGLAMRMVFDGTSNTVLVVDTPVKEAVVWTQPDDISFDSKNLREKLLNRFGDIALMAMADGSVRQVPGTVNNTALHNALNRNDGQANQRIGDAIPSQRRNRTFLSNWMTGIRSKDIDEVLAYRFVTEGVRNQIGFHVYDSEQMFDFQLTRFLGQMLGSFSTRNRFDDDFVPIFFLIASLNSPVYASIPLDDVEVVDQFLDHLDESLAPQARRQHSAGFFTTENDFYKIPINEDVIARTESISFGPVKWRFFWARIGDHLYLASKQEVLQDLVKAVKAPKAKETDADATAHAMVRIRPENWKQTLANYELGWAESHRLACLDNVGRISSMKQLANKDSDGENLELRAEQLYGVDFFCPCGGRYHLDDHGGLHCSVHGTALQPRQNGLGQDNGSIQEVLSQFGGMTLGLTFLEDGLHATLKIERKK